MEIFVNSFLAKVVLFHTTVVVLAALSGLRSVPEINAACSVTALLSSPRFSFKHTYFMIAGIAGVNPEVATLGSVVFSRYAVQVALQYEFDAREIPENFTTGYVPQGAYAPGQYPQSIYGTEVFEVNCNLRDIAMSLASTAVLNDSDAAIAYRANYATTAAYAAGADCPSVVAGDVATSDVYCDLAPLRGDLRQC